MNFFPPYMIAKGRVLQSAVIDESEVKQRPIRSIGQESELRRYSC
jgi:hypothetical protein